MKSGTKEECPVIRANRKSRSDIFHIKRDTTRSYCYHNVAQYLNGNPNSLVRSGMLSKEATTRQYVHRGYALSYGEYSQGACAIAAPIVGPSGQVVACMAVLGPRDRLPDSRVPPLRSTLLGAVKPLNEMLSQPAEPAPGRRRRQGVRRGAR